MSRYDYEASIDLPHASFAALIMAAMRRADTQNAALLRQAWPELWAELEARYNAPGGVLASDPTQGAA